jgi:RimJ/RimL family protein N-acetyltransferase
MHPIENITLRPIEPNDLDTLYQQQLDPEANWMAAFVSKDPTDRAAFDAHWAKILQSPQNINRTIVAEGQVVGHIACFPMEGELEITYWLGREFWGRGVATQALLKLLQLIPTRPIFGRAASDNPGSIRVMEKCGFKVIGTDKGFAHGRRGEIQETILRLDA